MMKLGIYVRCNHEVAITSRFKIHLYKYYQFYGCSLYFDDKLICIINRDLGNQKEAIYAFLNSQGNVISNSLRLEKMINSSWEEEIDERYEEKELIKLNPKDINHFRRVNIKKIKECLCDWAKGSRLDVSEDKFYFYMQTSLVQYQISIKDQGDIYCTARYIVFVDNGLFMGTQYFRIRNYLDNKSQFCWWRCYLGDKFWKTKFLPTKDKYFMLSEYDGIYLLLKKRTSNKIILFTGFDEEMSYSKGRQFFERFI